MPDASPSRPSRSPAPAGESMRDRLSAAARQRSSRPRAVLVIYAALLLVAITSFVGQLAGWWRSPIADKILEKRRTDAAKPAPDAPSPAAPSRSAPDGGR